MNRKLALFLCSIFLTALSAPAGSWAETDADVTAVVQGSNTFAFDLYGKLKQGEGNLFFSPFSLSSALAMTYTGARGDTAKQIAEALHFDLGEGLLPPALSALTTGLTAGSKEKGFELFIANALWGQTGYPFNAAFTDVTKNYFDAGFKEVDFAQDTENARAAINGWVAEKTANRILDLIGPGILTADSRLVLTNAIYFKGKWVSQFEEDRTQPEPFELISGEKPQVPLMRQTKKFKYYENETLQVLEMPYEGGKLSMAILLPKEPKGIQGLESSIAENDLKDWLSQAHKREVTVYLPRFRMDSKFLLKEPLQLLGIKDAFSNGSADFSGITPDTAGLYVFEVIHKAFVEVNEGGTEAAASTAVDMMLMTGPAPPKPQVFRADHPFIFIIRDMDSGSILFLGRMVDPR